MEVGKGNLENGRSVEGEGRLWDEQVEENRTGRGKNLRMMVEEEDGCWRGRWMMGRKNKLRKENKMQG